MIETLTEQQKSPRRRGVPFYWLFAAGALLLTLTGAAYVWLSDDFRTLPEFPTGRYITEPSSLNGGKFKADLVVEADLGYQPDKGRLMVFTEAESGQRLGVLLEGTASQIIFSKGQRYRLAIEVRKGGLLAAEKLGKL